MTHDRKYFGMTIQQIGILAGLAILACVLFSAAGTLLLRRGANAPRLSPAELTSMARPTSTFVMVSTVAATETPTPVPYEQLIPDGWTQHRTSLIEIWLPPGFKPADGDKLQAQGAKTFTKLGMEELIGADSMATAELVLADEVSGSPLYRTVASAAYEPLIFDSLEVYMDTRIQNYPPSITVTERKKVRVGANEAERIIFEIRLANLSLYYLSYYITDGGTIWRIRFEAEINEFYMLLPDFEKSVQTFRTVQ